MSPMTWELAALSAFAAGMFALAVWILFLRRESPEKRERRRRLHLYQHGRLADGMVTDVAPDSIYYCYSVAGVDYQTSQDVSRLAEFLPEQHDRLIGPVTLKYATRNPANSIVLCEKWSGLRNINKETVV